ncbi:MAG TPA: hypothetical protein VJK54_10735, partial [Chthoniobacterales bacterium]|nr:hypothetical protein [Chthoniobacterales bacterium]
IIKAQQEKESFQRADEIARNCLQDHSIHFFQEEHVKPQFLKDMGNVLKKNDEIADFAQRATTVRKLIFDETKMLEASLQEDSFWDIETIDSLWKIENARLTANTIASSADAEVARTFSSTDEMDACKKALKAIQTIQAAEEVLTQQTEMKWMKEDETAKNAWANNALFNVFFDQKGEMDKAVALAKTAEENFTSKLNKVKESYLALIAVAESLNEGSDALGSENEIEALRQWGGSIKSSWNEAKKAAAANQQAWAQAHHATKAAMDSKITWARNIFRLAGRCTGDFSLGQATKRDGEFLGNLWIGSDDHSHQDEEGFDMSNDQLKRFRPLAYKSNLKKYQMNFERRPTFNETWTQKGQLTKKGHANGHLTIINPHDEDAKESSLSRKFVALTTPSQFQEAYLEKRTEMQMEADGWFQEGQTMQNKLSTIKIQAKAARLDGRMLEAMELDHQASIIAKDLEKIWSLAQQAYQKGLHAAPDFDQDRWRWHLDMLNIQSRMCNIDGNEVLWSKAIEAMEEALFSILENDRNNKQKAHDLVAADNEELRGFWMEQIKELNISASQNDAFVFYCKANKERSFVKDSFKKAVADRAAHTEHEQVQAWDEIIQRINTTLPLLNKAIEKLNQYLVKAPEWDQLVVRQMIENAQDMKNQCKPSKFYAYTLKVNYLAEMGSARAIHAQQEQLWDDAIQEHKKVKDLLDRTSVEFKKGLAAVSKFRMDLTGWWKQSLLSLQDDSLRWHMKELTNIANKATFIATIASTKTAADVAVDREELWNDAIQKNEEARAAWERLIEKLETFPNQISILKTKCATEWTEPLKAAQDARDTRFFIIEQLKATRKERLSQKIQRVVKKK